MERTYNKNQKWCKPEEKEEEEEDEEEAALSLSDLPLIHHQSTKENDRPIESPEEFGFCSLLKESQMCAADEVFFQGQILPLRHSISSEKGCVKYSTTRSISRSESMDHLHSGGFISSRSSSISSGSSSSKSKPGLPTRIQFHSHPSPSPRIRFQNNRQHSIAAGHRNTIKKSSMWNIFRLGLVQPGPQEMAFQNLKARRSTSNISTNSRNFGSRNSTSSNCSSISSSKKKKARMFQGGGGCACSYDAVDTVPTEVVTIKRNASESEVDELHRVELEGTDDVEKSEPMMLAKKQATKKQLSHHRTFEWLKQLSLEGASDEA